MEKLLKRLNLNYWRVDKTFSIYTKQSWFAFKYVGNPRKEEILIIWMNVGRLNLRWYKKGSTKVS